MKLRFCLKQFLNCFALVAFTPKGGCPLKPRRAVQIRYTILAVAFTPKGGCPLKRNNGISRSEIVRGVAFTPKGGCPLKRVIHHLQAVFRIARSIHPQGWVPIETQTDAAASYAVTVIRVAFTPKGGCPLKLGAELV